MVPVLASFNEGLSCRSVSQIIPLLPYSLLVMEAIKALTKTEIGTRSGARTDRVFGRIVELRARKATKC